MTIDHYELAGFHLSDSLFIALILILLSEQVLAYVASFHLRPAGESSR
jgi:hypothetical protein